MQVARRYETCAYLQPAQAGFVTLSGGFAIPRQTKAKVRIGQT
jgi:hypothetical protein